MMMRKALFFILVVVTMIAAVFVACIESVSPQDKSLSPGPSKGQVAGWLNYQFHYYASYRNSGIGETESEYWKCDSYGFQIVYHMSNVSYSNRFYGPTQPWINSVKPQCWCPIQVKCTDLLVYEDAGPPAGECFPLSQYYYGRITEDGYFLDGANQQINFRQGHWYYITTCGFQTNYPHRPVQPPKFIIIYSWGEEKVLGGDAKVSAFDYRKKIDDIPVAFPGYVEKFYVVCNQTIYSDDDEDGRINAPGFSVWIENASGQVGRICDSTIYASGWLHPVRLPDWWLYKAR
jgi:hypothetical protein